MTSGGQPDEDVAPIPLMDKEFKEALLDNEDREEELAESGGAGDDESSEEDDAAPTESTDS